MSGPALPTPEQDTGGPSSPSLPSSSQAPGRQPSSQTAGPRPQRVLACLLCQQRKVKCDRRFPCANPVKHDARCVPATQPRRRKRRFPERELLERLRRYEELLRMNGVRFEPMHGEEEGSGQGQMHQQHRAGESSGRTDSPGGDEMDTDDEEQQAPGSRSRSGAGVDSASPSTTLRSESNYEAKDIFHAMNRGLHAVHSDAESQADDIERVIKKAWDSFSDDHILFGWRRSVVDLSTFHPEPAHIFRLWQIYLDNANPLLKVTHTPTLQARIVETVGNLKDVKPALEALMFAIYCVATLSLRSEECESIFGATKDELLTKYQFGCQQALLNSGFLRTVDRDCLTAFFLHLMSVRSNVEPRSLCSMLGMAVRIAKRMGIHNEAMLSRCSVFEAEMRRRLWWAFVLFDSRMSELSAYHAMALDPTWDCAIPLDVSDADLRPDMKEPPRPRGQPTETICVVVRSALGDFMRHSPSHLDLTNPVFKAIARELPNGGDLGTMEKMIEEKYLSLCDPENPLHFFTIWMTRATIAKVRLIDYYATFGSATHTGARPGSQVHHQATKFALAMLESDTKIMKAAFAKGYTWMMTMYFPFPAHIHIVQDLKRDPTAEYATRAWEAMSDNYESRFTIATPNDRSPFRAFTKIVFQGWLTAKAKLPEDAATQPRIITMIKEDMARLDQGMDVLGDGNGAGISGQGLGEAVTASTGAQVGDGISTDMDDFLTPLPMGFDGQSPGYGMGGMNSDSPGGGFPGAISPGFPGMPGPGMGAWPMQMNQLHWASLGWGFR